jgi:two-component system nitrate/nitrite response regulator NarL
VHILVVDDHPIICDALARYLERIGPQVAPTPVSVTSSSTLEGAIAAVKSSEPRVDMVFLDLNLDQNNHSTVTLERFQKENERQVPVVVFTGVSPSDPENTGLLKRCLKEFGAQTILTKGTNLETMFIGLPRILAGEKWLSNELISTLLVAADPTPQRSLDLTPRQWDVARGIARGLQNKTIARELNLSHQNVRQIVVSIYKRLGVHSRAELAIAVDKNSGAQASRTARGGLN